MANREFEIRKKRMTDVAAGIIPDRVPVCALMETYAFAYAGATVEDANKSIRKHITSYNKIYKDIYYDCAFMPSMSHALKLSQGLGSDVFFVSDDGVTVQHKEFCPMTEDDYEDLIKDPVMWIMDVFIPRKYPGFDQTNEKQKKAFLGSLKPFLEFALTTMAGNIYVNKVLKLPVVVGGSAEMPADMLFDYLRGFKPTITDIRRRPDEFERAVNALLDYCIDLMRMTYMMMGGTSAGMPMMAGNLINGIIRRKDFRFKEFPWMFNPCHIPPFLNPDQFRRFYWPTYKAMVEYLHSHGGHMMTFCEGDWGPNIELLSDLPDNSVTFICPTERIVEIKKIAKNNSVMGGMPQSMLKDSTLGECLDHAKRIVDECAPDGGFVFSTDKVLIAPTDAQADNLAAVNEFVHSYGIY